MKCAAFSLYCYIVAELFPPVLIPIAFGIKWKREGERECRMVCKKGTKKEKIKQKKAPCLCTRKIWESDACWRARVCVEWFAKLSHMYLHSLTHTHAKIVVVKMAFGTLCEKKMKLFISSINSLSLRSSTHLTFFLTKKNLRILQPSYPSTSRRFAGVFLLSSFRLHHRKTGWSRSSRGRLRL